MIYKRLTASEKAIRRWRGKRNRAVDQLLAAGPKLTRHEAMHQAAKVVGPARSAGRDTEPRRGAALLPPERHPTLFSAGPRLGPGFLTHDSRCGPFRGP